MARDINYSRGEIDPERTKTRPIRGKGDIGVTIILTISGYWGEGVTEKEVSRNCLKEK